MNDVYLKNRTSSAIPVAGYTVHYMDKTDAEIVEVEGVEDITRSDDASGTISAITLPTANSYTGVSFDSLRYYASGRISTTGTAFNLWQTSSTWYYGTITWTDESLGDLSDKIIVNSTSSSAMKTQTVFRIIFIYDSNISGYHPMDTAESSQGQITDYSYNNGVHSITFYFLGTNWTSGTFSGRIQFRYLDGVTTFNNLNAFDLVSASGGSLSKNTTSIRYDMYNVWNDSITIHAQYSVQKNQVKYNAFKYLLSSVPYWYVIDGIQTDWIDDLSSIGYSEVQLLPIVTKRNDLYIEPDNYNHQIGSGSEAFLYEYVNGSYRGLLYDDTTKKQCVYGWMYLNSGTWERYYYGLSAVLKSGTSNSLGVRNDTSSTIDVTRICYAECSDPLATIITVYNSQNAYFNAFKYTVNNVDYYYVLDGTQNDWTNDLSSIGYEIKDFEEITLYLASGAKAVQTDITSAFTGNVNSAYCYQLYTDEQCTTPWTGYDYSNDYEIWYYYNGTWVRQVDAISAMPDYTTTGTPLRTIGFILMDTGYLWVVSNITGSSYSITTSSITVRIYPKDQQVLALYFNQSSLYNNISMAYNTAYDMCGSPGTGTSPIPLTSNFPDKSIIGVYGSAGNLVSSGYKNFAWVGSTKLRVGYYNTDAGTLNARLLLFTTDQYIDIAYINTSGDTSVSSGTAMRLYSKEGYYLAYFPSLFTYTPLALFEHNGSCADNSSGKYIKSTTLGNYTGPSDALCLKQTYGRISFSYIWFLRTPISQ